MEIRISSDSSEKGSKKEEVVRRDKLFVAAIDVPVCAVRARTKQGVRVAVRVRLLVTMAGEVPVLSVGSLL